VLPKPFFPATAGRDYTLSPYLTTLAPFRHDFTVFSGLSHPAVEGGHSTENCFLTGARGPTKSGFRNAISLDQFAAERLGQATRFPTLNLGVNIDKANRSLSWTRDGVLLPAEDSAPALDRRLFLQGAPAEVERQLHRLAERGSILDLLLDDTRHYARALGRDDRARLEQYLTSVRELEQRLHRAAEWEQRPKPPAAGPAPADLEDCKLFFEKFDLMLSMARLALESDSTRIVTLMARCLRHPVFHLHPGQDTTDGYHDLSHHGQVRRKVPPTRRCRPPADGLTAEALREPRQHPGMATSACSIRTMVLYGSNMGDANTHDNTNFPILLAGSAFRHGQHLAFRSRQQHPAREPFRHDAPAQLGVEADAFSSSTGPLPALKPNPPDRSRLQRPTVASPPPAARALRYSAAAARGTSPTSRAARTGWPLRP
jgi:hypothetical protein